MSFSITKGSVEVNSGILIDKGSHSEIWEFDICEKYAEVISGRRCSLNPSENGCLLTVSPRDLYEGATEIFFERDDGWSIIATDVSRYTLVAVLMRR